MYSKWYFVPLDKKPVIRTFSKNSDLHCLETQKIDSDFIYSKKAVSTIYKSVLVIYSVSYNSQWIVVDKGFSPLCCQV